MKTRISAIILMAFILPVMVFAQSTTSVLVEAMAEPGAPAWLSSVTAWITTNLEVFGVAISIVGELLLRLIPSKKPRSILLMISASLKLICGVLDAISKFLDEKILQKTK